ncbi:MAG: hypothetical protein HYY01_03190 [Chloroflexi bacterium]|nr:hypothetical protein [Chloroflexota bacterium]
MVQHQLSTFSQALVAALEDCGATHVVSLPSTETSGLYEVLAQSRLRLVPVCREGEAIGIAAGLYCGGQKPVVMVQNTGFMESGDSVRGLAIPLRIPMPLYIGYRGYKPGGQPMTDTAGIYLEPILKAWGIKYYLVGPDGDIGLVHTGFQEAWETNRPVAVLLAAEQETLT